MYIPVNTEKLIAWNSLFLSYIWQGVGVKKKTISLATISSSQGSYIDGRQTTN